MSAHAHSARRRARSSRNGRTALAGLLALSVGLLATSGVYAALSATATGSEQVTAGTLQMTLTKDVGGGFASFTNAIAPGDQDNVYVNVNNTGTLASAAGMTLWVNGTPANALTNGSVAGEGLTVALTQCSVAWTLATGACSGVTTPLLAATPVSSMDTSATAAALANVPALAAATGQVAHVQVSLGMQGNETSLNGALPSQTVQGLTTTLTYTFTELQRTATATNK